MSYIERGLKHEEHPMPLLNGIGCSHVGRTADAHEDGGSSLIGDAKVIQRCFEAVLSCKTCVHEEAAFCVPFREAAVVVALHLIFDDEWRDRIREAFLEHDEAPDASIAILEGVDALECHMERHDVLQCMLRFGVVTSEQAVDLCGHLFGKRRASSRYLIGQLLVVAHIEPILRGIGGAGFEHAMQLLEHPRRERFERILYHEVYGAEMVGCLDEVVDVDGFGLHSDGRGLEDQTRLIEGELAAFDVVGVVGELYLDLVIDAAFGPRRHLAMQSLEER